LFTHPVIYFLTRRPTYFRTVFHFIEDIVYTRGQVLIRPNRTEFDAVSLRQVGLVQLFRVKLQKYIWKVEISLLIFLFCKGILVNEKGVETYIFWYLYIKYTTYTRSGSGFYRKGQKSNLKQAKVLVYIGQKTLLFFWQKPTQASRREKSSHAAKGWITEW
jgi:hypothetical protein